MKRALIVLIVVIAAAAAVTHFASARNGRLGVARLQQAYSATNNLDYIGTVTTSISYCGRDFRGKSLVRHKGSGERIEYLSGPTTGAVIITKDGETRTYRPHTGQALVSQTGGRQAGRGGLELLIKNYNASVVGGGRVAGRPVDIVSLTPKHKGNPSKRLWIDRRTGVILKSEDRSTSGRVRSAMEFTQIDYGVRITDGIFREPAGTAAVRPKSDGNREQNAAELGKVVGIPVVFPKYVPAGYVFDSMTAYTCECECGHKAAHLRYTNGLNSISIFEAPMRPACGHQGCKIHCQMAGKCEVRDSCQARVAIASSGDRNIVVVADLQKEEIERVAKSCVTTHQSQGEKQAPPRAPLPGSP